MLYQQPQSGRITLEYDNPLARQVRRGLIVERGLRLMTPLLQGDVNNYNGYGPTGVMGRATTTHGIFQTHGGGDYADSSSGLAFTTDGLGLFEACYFYAANGSSTVIMESYGAGSQADGQIKLNSSGTISASANGNVSLTSAAINPGYHLVLWGNDRVGGVQQLWVDGALLSTATSTAQQGYTSNFLSTGDKASGTISIGYTVFGLGKNYQTLARALAANPWQIFRSSQRRLYFGAASGGSVGAAAGASIVQGIYGFIAQAQGQSVVSGKSATGSIGSAVGRSITQAIEGYVARATGSSIAQGIEGYIGRSTSTSVVSGVSQTGSIGAAAGHSNVLGIAGFVAKAASASIAKGLRGSIGNAVSASVATARSATGSVGAAVGASIVSGVSIFAPKGTGIAVGQSIASALSLGRSLGIGDYPVPRSIVTQGDVTPAMRQWMVSVETALAGLVSNLQSPLAAKGDLWGFDSANNRLPIGATGYGLRANNTASMGASWDGLLVPTPGANGYVLTADSAQPFGYAWEVLTMPTTGTWQLFQPAAGTSGNWTVPSDVDTVYVTMVGGGGAGSANVSQNAGGAGGGGAEYCYRFPVFVTPSSIVAYAVGTGGAGGSLALGANGTSTTFGAFSVAGGQGAGAGNGGNGGGRLGPAGGASTGAAPVSEGAFFWAGAAGGGAGAAGGPCEEYVGNPTHAGGGSGASSPFGQGGAGSPLNANSQNGSSATAPGSGGGGAYRGGVGSPSGGNGGPGALYVEFFSAT